MDLMETLRARAKRRAATAPVDCGALGVLNAQALSPGDFALFSRRGDRAVLYAACRDLQAVGEQLRREGAVFTPEEVMRYVTDAEAYAGAAAVAALSGMALPPDGGNTGTETSGTETSGTETSGTETSGDGQPSGADTAELTGDGGNGDASDVGRTEESAHRTEPAAPLPDTGAETGEAAENAAGNGAAFRSDAVQTDVRRIYGNITEMYGNITEHLRNITDAPGDRGNRPDFVQYITEGKNSEVRLCSVQAKDGTEEQKVRLETVQGQVDAAEGGETHGQVSHETCPPAEGDGARVPPADSADSREKAQIMGETGERETQNVGQSQPGAAALRDRPTAAAETTPGREQGTMHETESELRPSGGEGLHEIESEIQGQAHEIKSEFPAEKGEGLHETESEFAEIPARRMHEVESEFTPGEVRLLHEIMSEYGGFAGDGVHENESELPETLHETTSENGKRTHETTSERPETGGEVSEEGAERLFRFLLEGLKRADAVR